MSGISSVTGGYGTTISLTDLLVGDNRKTSAASAYSAKTYAAAATETDDQSAGTSAEVVRAALQKAVQELAKAEGGSITFTKIAAYRQDLEKEFAQKMRDGLKEAGLPEDTVFTLTLSKEGAIQVQCEDEASRAAIEQYLSENRKLCEEFGYIQALGSLEKADRHAASRGLGSLGTTRAEIQATAVNAFFDAALQSGFMPSSLNATFDSEGSAAFYSGISALV